MQDEQILHQSEDEFGPLIVLDDKHMRVLSFGDNDEQSKLLKSEPHLPQHLYLQAMLLVLLFIKPKRVIILGLGGGGLIHALRNFDRGLKVTAVELRQGVIDIAKRYFQLPIGKKLTVEHQDAKQFLAKREHKKADVIFADIYDGQGVDESQLTEAFIADAAAMIKADGYLVLNCWKEHSQNLALLGHLQKHFVNVRACLTGSGNWVVFAGKQGCDMGAAEIKRSANQLGLQLDFNIGRHLSRFGLWE
ncbi:fused MFS/spermidine synthase [Shewanella eurypsychrophilus]|uniref:Fused MFS/spermidine synthase n=1 Tax=Shewanella eurypsychrophilus TaxID=2593656 RepID=A0ABX6V2A6_9GAMM|nr:MULTISPECIES: fused MFS/spermidine synthase [Shewanella]QFU21411.1 spermidine synthase [Shewanella sp. YLB-09]QPG56701.1 fused MFS/spermidine synthase [Shewanella eurypsychrophilus]